MNIVNYMRQDKDFFFRTDRNSPIPDEEKEKFEGLNYFPYDENYCFALDMEVHKWPTEIMIPTNAGEEAAYVRHGQIRFKVGGVEQLLTVFRSEQGLFLPFMDGTTGIETYEGGRYLEPEMDVTGKCLVDFNLAYNPFCAYGGPDWSCPIPPVENRIKARMVVGEKKYKLKGAALTQ